MLIVCLLISIALIVTGIIWDNIDKWAEDGPFACKIIGTICAILTVVVMMIAINDTVSIPVTEQKIIIYEEENNIIEQNPKFEENKEKVLVEAGDTITLYIPNIINQYPDMVDEGWTLNDVIAFSEEYKLKLTVYDSTGKTTIPKEEYTNFNNNKVIYQQREVGDTIIEGINFYIHLNAQYNTLATN